MTRIEATNHLGWQVQWLTNIGWMPWNGELHTSIEAAQKQQSLLNIMYEGSTEYRVYELVTEKEQA